VGFELSVFEGLSAFPVTPSNADGVVDCDHLGKLINHLDRDGISSIGVLGSTGGYMYLTTKERDRAVCAAVEAAGTKPVLAGIGALRTNDVIANVRSAEKAGAQGLLLAPVSYLPLKEADVQSLFEDVAKATDLPICFYNNPTTTNFNLKESQLIQLANAGTIAAVKNPPAPQGKFTEQIVRLRAEVPTNFCLGYSGDSSISGALEAGADAWYSVLAGTLPDAAIALWKARNDTDKLTALNAELSPLWTLFDAHGSIRVIYEIVDMVGLGDVKLPAPLLPLDADARNEIEQALNSIKAMEDKAA
jgi:4-hydroxy-tetrahydrodipicolinate synthase